MDASTGCTDVHSNGKNRNRLKSRTSESVNGGQAKPPNSPTSWPRELALGGDKVVLASIEVREAGDRDGERTGGMVGTNGGGDVDS